MIEEYVTGAVLDALESPRVQQAVTARADTDAPRRAELLEEIGKAQAKRAEARRDWAEDVIDKEDWLDIKQRTDDRINRARTEYDRLTGTATVFGDVPPSDAVRDAWLEWNTDRRRAAIKAVLSQVTVSPDTPGRTGTRNRALRIEALRRRTQFDWRL